MSRAISHGARRLAALAVTILLMGGWTAAGARAPQDGAAGRVGALLDQAQDLGAKGQLPTSWWDLEERYNRASEGGADEAAWAALESEARRLVNQAAFIEEMRRRKSGMEALLGRFDQALAEIGALYGVAPAPELTGTAAARDLLDRLDAENLRRQVLIDSLTIDNRHLAELAGGQAAGSDSLVVSLQIEVSRLRQRLWETELRAGVAEADRSAAETVLTAKQQREASVAAIRALFTPAEAEILQTGGGDLLLRVHGLDFAVGSANLQSDQGELIDRLADALRLFPTAPVRLEGHTDDTGSRDANLRLSRRRAESVAAVLADRLGRDVSGFAIEGYGPDRPVALNATPEGRALNRRIDVVISPGD